MKCYKHLIPIVSLPVDEETIAPPAKLLGSSIADGRYNGVCDGSAGLLRGQYDNDDSMTIDPLCDLSSDRFDLRQSFSKPSSQSSSDSAFSDSSAE